MVPGLEASGVQEESFFLCDGDVGPLRVRRFPFNKLNSGVVWLADFVRGLQ
jgi:hypothetical protein